MRDAAQCRHVREGLQGVTRARAAEGHRLERIRLLPDGPEPLWRTMEEGEKSGALRRGPRPLEVTGKRCLTAHEVQLLLPTGNTFQSAKQTEAKAMAGVVEPSGEPHPSQAQNRVQRPQNRGQAVKKKRYPKTPPNKGG